MQEHDLPPDNSLEDGQDKNKDLKPILDDNILNPERIIDVNSSLPLNDAIQRLKEITGIKADVPIDNPTENNEVDNFIEFIGEDSLIYDLKEFIKENYRLRRNVITRNIEMNGNQLKDLDLNSIFIATRERFKKSTKDLVCSIIYSDHTAEYNPFAELLYHYANNPPKQKTGHIEQLIESINTDTPNASIFIKKWLVSLIASINWKHSPLLLVLCGGQNTGKTYWFRNLLPECLKSYYTESKLDGGKDDEILMTKFLIIQDDEFGGKSKTEQRKLKELTSKQSFSIRAPYGRVSEDLTRLAMLCGTTNDEQILNDPTGNRRILPVRVLKINHEKYNSVNKDLLFFECWLEYEKGYNYNLTQDEIKLLNDSTTDFIQSCSEEELVLTYYGHPDEYPQSPVKELTNAEILSNIQDKSRLHLSPNKLGSILHKLGIDSYHKRVMKTTKRVYRLVEL